MGCCVIAARLARSRRGVHSPTSTLRRPPSRTPSARCRQTRRPCPSGWRIACAPASRAAACVSASAWTPYSQRLALSRGRSICRPPTPTARRPPCSKREPVTARHRHVPACARGMRLYSPRCARSPPTWTLVVGNPAPGRTKRFANTQQGPCRLHRPSFPAPPRSRPCPRDRSQHRSVHQTLFKFIKFECLLRSDLGTRSKKHEEYACSNMHALICML